MLTGWNVCLKNDLIVWMCFPVVRPPVLLKQNNSCDFIWEVLLSDRNFATLLDWPLRIVLHAHIAKNKTYDIFDIIPSKIEPNSTGLSYVNEFR